MDNLGPASNFQNELRDDSAFQQKLIKSEGSGRGRAGSALQWMLRAFWRGEERMDTLFIVAKPDISEVTAKRPPSRCSKLSSSPVIS